MVNMMRCKYNQYFKNKAFSVYYPRPLSSFFTRVRCHGMKDKGDNLLKRQGEVGELKRDCYDDGKH